MLDAAVLPGIISSAWLISTGEDEALERVEGSIDGVATSPRGVLGEKKRERDDALIADRESVRERPWHSSRESADPGGFRVERGPASVRLSIEERERGESRSGGSSALSRRLPTGWAFASLFSPTLSTSSSQIVRIVQPECPRCSSGAQVRRHNKLSAGANFF